MSAQVASAASVTEPGAPEAPYARLQTLAREITYSRAKTHPLVATSLGLREYDGTLDTPSRDANARDLAQIKRWEANLAAIPLDRANLVERDDAALLRAQLIGYERAYTVAKTFEKDPSAPGQDIVRAIFTHFQQLPTVGVAGSTRADVVQAWSDIVARLTAAPAYIKAGETLVTRPGHLYGVVGSQQLAGAPDFFNGALSDAAKAQLSADSFARFVAARDTTLAAIAREKAAIDAHVATWPENYVMGRRAYDTMLQDEQLLPFSSVDVERMAHDELAHGWAVQSWVEDLAKQQHTAIGAPSGGGLAPGGPALIGYYRTRIAQLQSFVIAHDVIDVPTWLGAVKVVETPNFCNPSPPERR